MPEFLERRLRAEASSKGFTGRKADEYVYGAMNNEGAMHGNKITAKGREMERKHEDDMKNNLREMRIEIHRAKPAGKSTGPGEVTGHTVHHHMIPKPSKSPAFMEETHESYPFDADGESSTHGNMLNHIGKHLGLAAATEEEHEPDEGENDEEEAG